MGICSTKFATKFVTFSKALIVIVFSGTSFTSTLVSLTQIQDQSKFKRAFSTGVIHDMFNWLTVITLLSVEVTTHFLFHITNAMVSGLDTDSASRQKPPDLLKAITKPFTNSIVQIDKKVSHL
jgi:sodium-dependent phosphate cotransporter